MGRKKKHFWKPAAAGFAVMYLATMALATGLVKERFAKEDELRVEGAALAMLKSAEEKELPDKQQGPYQQEIVWDRDQRKDFYQNLADNLPWQVNSESVQVSMAVYDKDKSLLAKSRDGIGGNPVWEENTVIREYASFALDDYLSPEEKERLAQYAAEDIRRRRQGWEFGEKYRFSMRVSPDWKELWEIYVQEITWEEDTGEEDTWYEDPLTGSFYSLETGGVIDYATGEETGKSKLFYEVNGDVVWKWTNPAVDAEKLNGGNLVNTGLSLPYLNLYYAGTFSKWQKWTKSPYLNRFTEPGELFWEKGTEIPALRIEEDKLYRRGRMQLQAGMVGNPFACMEIRMESRPWHAALNYMKYVYAAGAVLTAVCMLAVTSMMDKVYHRQAVLEETRRDLTNAIAHELKTPLGVIRNFAENLLEYHKEEKREYYLLQIIGQTEEMDRLVREMIEMSKLDSEELVLKKEEVSFLALLQEQIGRLRPVIAEKRLQVEFMVQDNEDFLVQGDREYLAKAVWNLLANAVDYNVESGKILLKVSKEACMIENSGKAIEEEALIHAFDLFYTGNKSRTEKKHMGLGLYLAKKILELHRLNLTLDNCSDGVQAVIRPFVRRNDLFQP